MKLDVIIPVRNCPARVTRLLMSLSRELKNEPRAGAIIIDDASTDDTPDVCRRFVEGMDGRVNFSYNETRKNAGGARNNGVRLSCADYVCFFDADDDIAEGALKKICDALEKDSPEMLIWGFLRVGKEGSKVWLPDFKEPRDFTKSPCAPWLKAVRRDLFVRFDEGVYCEDCPWWLRQADCADPAKVSVIAEPLYIYDRRENCFSNTLEFFGAQPCTLEYLAYSDMLVKRGMNDRAPSDCLRNLATLYDLRHELKHDYVKAVWANRLHNDYVNILSGRWCF